MGFDIIPGTTGIASRYVELLNHSVGEGDHVSYLLGLRGLLRRAFNCGEKA